MMFPEFRTEQSRQNCGKTAAISLNRDDAGYISVSTMKWATITLLAYFCARLFFFAVNISSFVPPDEFTHAGLCKIFSKVFLFPDNSPATYEFGLVTNIPWLYYWIMGKLLHLNFFGITDLVFLRLLNIILVFGTVWYAVRLLRLLTDDRLTQLLLLVVITNTPMLSLLSASVSYDNLANLLAAMAIYYEFAFFKNRSGSLLVASLLCQMAGNLTKVTFLPLALALCVLLLIHEVRSLRALPAVLKGYFKSCAFKESLLMLLLFIALGLNLHLYAGNYLRLGKMSPSMTDVFPAHIATQFGIAARETIFREYSEGRITYMDALILTGEIKHPGNKADTFYLLMNYENFKRNPQYWMGPFTYARFWFENMAGSIFGIKGHLQMFKESRYITPVYLIMAFSVLGFFVRWRQRDSGWLPLFLVAIVCFYSALLLFKINYSAYLYYGTPGITLQGRYLFPVIGPVYVLACYYLLQLFRTDNIRLALSLVTAMLFISYDFPWFLMHATPEWYEWMPG